MFRFSFLHTLALSAALLAGFHPALLKAALNGQELAIFEKMQGASGQRRPTLKIDPVLSQVARARAADMARRDYFAHNSPDGQSPNALVRKAGYELPASYPSNGNNVESIAAGRDSASATWNDWMGSGSHKRHLLGESSFYAEQTAVGIGYVFDGGSTYHHYWVVITAPPSATVNLGIRTPAQNARLGNPEVTVSGTTDGGIPVQSVQVRVENAAGSGAFRTAYGTANWNIAMAGLIPGPNTIRIQALDGSGKVLAQATRKVSYVVKTELVVSVAGEGNITNGFDGTSQRDLGRKYTIKAKPAAGWLFTGWSGGIASSQAKISFTMKEGMVLAATFVANPFAERKGKYTGLLTTGPDRNADGTGRMQLKLNAKGAFTGQIVLGGVRQNLKGKFDSTGAATVKLGKSGGVATLQLDVEGDGGVSASVTKGGVTSTSVATLGATKDGGFRNAGRYTVAIPRSSEEAAEAVPAGDGYGTLVVKPSGQARLVGSLPDGTGFSVAATFDEGGAAAIYAPLYAKRGAIAGTLRVSETEESDMAGEVLWSKPQTSGGHAAEFATIAPVVASRYQAPNAGETALGLTPGENNVALWLEAGGLTQPVTQPLTLDGRNRIRLSNAKLAGMRVKLNAATGVFSGSFVHPVTGASTRMAGAILQKQNAGFGYFLGENESGFTSLAGAE
ncbi:MAG: CAP domain-containing protein [Chthoniobacteraceae bacterium]